MDNSDYKQNEITYLNFLYNEVVTGLRNTGGINTIAVVQNVPMKKDPLLDVARELVK